MLPNKLAFVDIETTGGSIFRDRVIEVGVLRVEDGKLVETFNTLLNPDTKLPPEIELLTGITQADLSGAPSFYEIKKDLFKILEDCLFVAHNVRFDFSFLKKEFSRFEMDFSPKQLCTVKLSRALFPEYRHHNLDSLIERFNFKVKNRHRAFEDAEILWKFYKKTQKQFSETIFLEALNKIQKRPTLPTKLSQEVLDSIPDTPGVYIFYGENKTVLYVGKSKNLRTRVMSHFSSDHSSQKELKIAQLIESLEVIETPGELGALIKEAELVKKLQPLYNRKLRILRKMILVKMAKNKDDYYQVEIEETDQINFDDIENIVGIFKSKKQAKTALLEICKEFELCPKLLKLENTKTACFNYRLGKCSGACTKKETTTKYNFKFLKAFLNSKIKPWPFTGPIIIYEKDSFKNNSQGFLMDKWCLLKVLEEDPKTLNFKKDDYIFDLDTYKILESYLRVSKNLLKIHTLNPNLQSQQNVPLII